MSNATANNSTLKGSLANVIDFLERRDGDEADQLAQRAISVMLATNLPQTGYEVDIDPFVANMFASSALLSISDHLKHYPFVREPRPLGFNESGSMSGYSSDADVLAAARHMVELAERMLRQPEPILEVDFFAIGRSGGTDFAPALEAMLHILENGGSPFNQYVIIISDGDAPSAS